MFINRILSICSTLADTDYSHMLSCVTVKCGSEVLYREVVGGCDYTVHCRATVTHTNKIVIVSST